VQRPRAQRLLSYRRTVTRWGMAYGVFVFMSAIVTVSCGLLAWFDGDFWQSLLLALGGTYLALWSALRLAAPATK